MESKELLTASEFEDATISDMAGDISSSENENVEVQGGKSLREKNGFFLKKIAQCLLKLKKPRRRQTRSFFSAGLQPRQNETTLEMGKKEKRIRRGRR